MNTDLARLIEALRRTLDESVAPELSSDFARGQLAAVHDILGKLAGMTVWDPAALHEQAQALRGGLARFAERAAQAGVVLPPAAHEADPADLDAAQARARELTDWLDAQANALPADLIAELDAILRDTLRDELRLQRKRIPLTDFSAMTAAASKD
jgi:hypothetical protein